MNKKVNFYCCHHERNKNMYHLGYVGLKFFKVAVCLDCEKVQFIGGKIGKILYPTAKRLYFNRITIIKTIDVKIGSNEK